MADRLSVAIIIVSYNVRDELDACLKSLASEINDLGTTVAVVDNASSDGTAESVRERWPAVRLIEAGENIGFARGNNLGIRGTTSELVLLLNPDTIVPPGTVARLVAALVTDPQAAAVAPRLRSPEGYPELSFGWTISPLGELRQKLLGALYDRRVGFAVRFVEKWANTPGERDWVSGACVLVRRSDLEAVGLLDERYFMYTEDVDLCLALRARGRRILFRPDVEVLHMRGQSASKNPSIQRLRRKSQIAFYEKHHPAWVPLLRLYLRLRD